MIIDGVSIDDTLNIAESHNDSRIKIYSEPDYGIYDAMNKGIGLAKGNWLLFLGSDDSFYDETVLEDVYNFLQATHEKVIYGNVLLSGDTGWGKANQIYDGKFDVNRLLKNNIAHQSIFYNREVFEKCGVYNLKYNICADYDFNLRAAALFNLKYIDRIVARFNAGGASTNATDANFGEDFIANIKRYFGSRLLGESFRFLEHNFLYQAKIELNNYHVVNSLTCLFVGYYHKIFRRMLND